MIEQMKWNKIESSIFFAANLSMTFPTLISTSLRLWNSFKFDCSTNLDQSKIIGIVD